MSEDIPIAEVLSEGSAEGTDCIVHDHPVPAEMLDRYAVDNDPHSEQDIRRYVEIEAPDETVNHVEKIKREIVIGETFDIWDVITNKDRYWVITSMTNLYSQKHFPSLDYTLSFHIGLMMRLRSRPSGPDSDDPTPFDDVFRRQEHAKNKFDAAIEAEDYQAVGMELRECLIALMGAVRRKVTFEVVEDRPQDANVVGWSSLICDRLCSGSSSKELRQYLKGIAKDTWQLVNWVTHDRNAGKTATSIAIHGCDTVVGHYIQILERSKRDNAERCPVCKSRDVRTHYDPSLGDDGEYYNTCGVCDWNSAEESNPSSSSE